MAKPPVAIQNILRVHSFTATGEEDLLAAEEPLAIHLGFGSASERVQRELAVTMRTPGHDLELVLGFLLTEGIIERLEDVRSIRHCTQLEPGLGENLVRVELEEHVQPSPVLLKRQTFLSSSCGICGKTSIDAVRCLRPPAPNPASWQIPASQLHALSTAVSAQQRAFSATGGMHAAALFNTAGELLALREDIGRHNAVDKIIGNALTQSQLPLSQHLLFLSGRASFELIQKAALAGIPLVCAVGAPSSLAVEAAQQFEITLAGFLRNNRFNLYSHPNRILLESQPPTTPTTSASSLAAP